MNRRQLKKAQRQIDREGFNAWADTPNGSARLQAIYQAVADVDDTLEAINGAIDDGDTDEAQRLIALGSDSLAEHIAELKGLL